MRVCINVSGFCAENLDALLAARNYTGVGALFATGAVSDKTWVALLLSDNPAVNYRVVEFVLYASLYARGARAEEYKRSFAHVLAEYATKFKQLSWLETRRAAIFTSLQFGCTPEYAADCIKTFSAELALTQGFPKPLLARVAHPPVPCTQYYSERFDLWFPLSSKHVSREVLEMCACPTLIDTEINEVVEHMLVADKHTSVFAACVGRLNSEAVSFLLQIAPLHPLAKYSFPLGLDNKKNMLTVDMAASSLAPVELGSLDKTSGPADEISTVGVVAAMRASYRTSACFLHQIKVREVLESGLLPTKLVTSIPESLKDAYAYRKTIPLGTIVNYIHAGLVAASVFERSVVHIFVDGLLHGRCIRARRDLKVRRTYLLWQHVCMMSVICALEKAGAYAKLYTSPACSIISMLTGIVVASMNYPGSRLDETFGVVQIPRANCRIAQAVCFVASAGTGIPVYAAGRECTTPASEKGPKTPGSSVNAGAAQIPLADIAPKLVVAMLLDDDGVLPRNMASASTCVMATSVCIGDGDAAMQRLLESVLVPGRAPEIAHSDLCMHIQASISAQPYRIPGLRNDAEVSPVDLTVATFAEFLSEDAANHFGGIAVSLSRVMDSIDKIHAGCAWKFIKDAVCHAENNVAVPMMRKKALSLAIGDPHRGDATSSPCAAPLPAAETARPQEKNPAPTQESVLVTASAFAFAMAMAALPESPSEDKKRKRPLEIIDKSISKLRKDVVQLTRSLKEATERCAWAEKARAHINDWTTELVTKVDKKKRAAAANLAESLALEQRSHAATKARFAAYTEARSQIENSQKMLSAALGLLCDNDSNGAEAATAAPTTK